MDPLLFEGDKVPNEGLIVEETNRILIGRPEGVHLYDARVEVHNVGFRISVVCGGPEITCPACIFVIT